MNSSKMMWTKNNKCLRKQYLKKQYLKKRCLKKKPNQQIPNHSLEKVKNMKNKTDVCIQF